MAGGRPKGSTGKIGTKIAEMVSEALTRAGGVDYLARQAEENPSAFMTMAAKLMPKDINLGGQEDGEPLKTKLTIEFVKPS